MGKRARTVTCPQVSHVVLSDPQALWAPDGQASLESASQMPESGLGVPNPAFLKVIPKASSGGLNYFQNNTERLLAFSFSLSPNRTMEFSTGYTRCDTAMYRLNAQADEKQTIVYQVKRFAKIFNTTLLIAFWNDYLTTLLYVMGLFLN